MDTVRLPHLRLLAYSVAIELLRAVRAAKVRDAGLRDQAMRAAKSACLNAAEGAGRVSRADKARVFGIARAEAGEAAAAVGIAGGGWRCRGRGALERTRALRERRTGSIAMMTVG